MGGKRAYAALAAMVVIGGCSPGAESETPAPGAPAIVTATPAAEVAYPARRQAVLSIPNPDGLVAVAGSVWVKTDDGMVVRVDPRTNKVTGKVKVDTATEDHNYCMGIGTDETTVWACAATDSGTEVVQVDPRTLKVLKRVQVGKLFDQLTLPATARGIWVLTKGGEAVSVVESDGRVSTYPLGARCRQLAADADRVVATCPQANTVIAVDSVTGAVAGKAELQAPGIVTLAADDVWVDADGGLTRLSRELEVRAIYPDLGAGNSGDLLATTDEVLVRTADGTITTIEADGGEVTERLTPEEKLTPGSLLVAFESVWTSSSDDARLVRLAQ